MALIQCSECGRTVSDQARVCVGCGAPLSLSKPSAWRRAGFNLAPERSHAPPPTRRQLLWRAAASALALALGLFAAGAYGHRVGAGHIVSTLAALLVVVGLCGIIVTGVQLLMLRR
jgi:hypothetical protein